MTIILVVVLCAGICLLLYPTVSDWWNSTRQSYAAGAYTEAVENLESGEIEDLWRRAQAYNESLAEYGNSWVLSDAQEARYREQLSGEGTSVMSYIEIPVIRCKLPVYHGTSDDVLQVAVGHIEGSSLPVGGESSHCALSGHRGLATAKLFTDLDRLKAGDVFMLTTLGRTLTYEVDQVRIVDPDQIEDIRIVEGEDLCTLVTCTPYGVNTQRLLVRGHRVDNQEKTLVPADALRIESLLVALCLAVPVLVILFFGAMLTGGRRDPHSEGGFSDGP